MKQIDCRGCIVTADAMNTQKATAEAVIKQARDDYCHSLKGNYRTVCQQVKEYFAWEELLKKIMKKRGSISRKRKRKLMKRSQGNTSLLTAKPIAVCYFTVFPDEFSYWASAVKMAGYDWNDMVALGSYYSFRYGFLLFPVLKICADGIVAFRVAIGLNAAVM